MNATVTADLFVSVDGWARGLTSPAFFGYDGPDLQRWIAEETTAPHRDLMGRRTYELLAGLSTEDRDEQDVRDEQAPGAPDHAPSPPTTVFSRTLLETSWPHASLEPRDAVEAVRELRSGSDVPMRTVGSLSLVRQLLDAGLVDRLRLLVFPLVVGRGGREAALAGVAERDLELTGHRVLDDRILLLEYAPTVRDVPHASATGPVA